jgi:hypothetical protein
LRPQQLAAAATLSGIRLRVLTSTPEIVFARSTWTLIPDGMVQCWTRLEPMAVSVLDILPLAVCSCAPWAFADPQKWDWMVASSAWTSPNP